MKRNIWFKRFVVSSLLLPISYFIFLGILYWKWLIPHYEIPKGHYNFGESIHFNKDYQKKSSVIHDYLKIKTKESGLVSISLSYAIDGILTWSGTSGLSDIENMKPSSVSSQYRAGSISKSMTALLTARLVDQNKFDIDANINEYLKDYPRGDEITSRMLGTHTSGIRHYQYDFFSWPPNDMFSATNYQTVAEAIEMFKNDKLLFNPGKQFSYSSYGYNLLSRVIEGSTNEDFLVLMDREVFQPLNLRNTEADKKLIDVPNRVNFYTAGDNKYGYAYPVDSSNKWAGGGFLSTPTDLVKLGLSTLSRDFISRKSKDFLFTPTDISKIGYGFGWLIRERSINEKKFLTWSHSGGSMGGTSYLLIIPELEMVISAQSNVGPYPEGVSGLGDLCEQVAHILLSEEI